MTPEQYKMLLQDMNTNTSILVLILGSTGLAIVGLLIGILAKLSDISQLLNNC